MVELLSPAGNYEGFLGAIHAGADAIYLAGNKYGARAFADNFTEEEIISAITYAHLFHKKVYLTVNTLLKEEEMAGLYEYLTPLYEAKLDGVIIQDMGVFHWIKRNFPDLELHCSTQMAITGVYGAKHLKELGASRIVVARELGLEEIKSIIEEVDVELETFVHGSMCYAYSGNCLFSSMLGGRSGNRGKCAQPCRLPYQLEHVSKHEEYLLSLKDMCLLPQLQSLLDAGVHSLKIEGRMKRPEYTAGVTAIYRKYIDAYYQNPNEALRIQEADLECLTTLYMRSELSEGYHERHNGVEMVTLQEPSYGVIPNDLLEGLRARYIKDAWKIPVEVKVCIRVGEPIEVTVNNPRYGSVTVEGDVILEAMKQPLTEEAVSKQFMKMGATHFTISDLKILIEGNSFLPVKSMNEVRRIAIESFQDMILNNYANRNQYRHGEQPLVQGDSSERREVGSNFHVGVMTLSQLEVVVKSEGISRLYIESDLCKVWSQVEQSLFAYKEQSSGEVYVKLPYILRRRSYEQLVVLQQVVAQELVSGVLVRNFESLEWLTEIAYKGKIIIDSNVYSFNKEAIAYYRDKGYEMIVPYELNQAQLRELQFVNASYYCYGKVPMMISANCVYQTKKKCGMVKNEFVALIDRYNKKLPVYLNCNYCYNVIYNSVPLSLHQSVLTFAKKYQLQAVLNFTDEVPEEMEKILLFYKETFLVTKRDADAIGIAYTKGHLKRGVE